MLLAFYQIKNVIFFWILAFLKMFCNAEITYWTKTKPWSKKGGLNRIVEKVNLLDPHEKKHILLELCNKGECDQ